MKQLTLRGFDAPLLKRLRSVARERRVSLNKAALWLLRRGAGLAAEESLPAVDAIGSELDEFIGSWTREEERRFLASLEPLEQVDEALWK